MTLPSDVAAWVQDLQRIIDEHFEFDARLEETIRQKRVAGQALYADGYLTDPEFLAAYFVEFVNERPTAWRQVLNLYHRAVANGWVVTDPAVEAELSRRAYPPVKQVGDIVQEAKQAVDQASSDFLSDVDQLLRR